MIIFFVISNHMSCLHFEIPHQISSTWPLYFHILRQVISTSIFIRTAKTNASSVNIALKHLPWGNIWKLILTNTRASSLTPVWSVPSVSPPGQSWTDMPASMGVWSPSRVLYATRASCRRLSYRTISTRIRKSNPTTVASALRVSYRGTPISNTWRLSTGWSLLTRLTWACRRPCIIRRIYSSNNNNTTTSSNSSRHPLTPSLHTQRTSLLPSLYNTYHPLCNIKLVRTSTLAYNIYNRIWTFNRTYNRICSKTYNIYCSRTCNMWLPIAPIICPSRECISCMHCTMTATWPPRRLLCSRNNEISDGWIMDVDGFRSSRQVIGFQEIRRVAA